MGQGKLIALLQEAKNQIEYLHNKFQETGSGNAVISQLQAGISSLEKEILSNIWFSLDDMEYIWQEGVRWGDANCETGGETRLPRFDEVVKCLPSKK